MGTAGEHYGMVKWQGVMMTMVLALAACGPRPPTDSFSANVDGNCNPDDIVDMVRSWITPETFWREQEDDFLSYVSAGRKNLKISTELHDENRLNRGSYHVLASQRGQQLGLKGKVLKDMVDANMAEFDAAALHFNANIAQQKLELAWSSKCLTRARTELRKQGVAPR